MEAWVKYQYPRQRMVESHSVTLTEARDRYWKVVKENEVIFAQFGAKTDEGTIVLGEFRPER